ncbi:MAG: tRNA (adenosine(37)-N6)-threonylcarbamoyltransferase complex ATPase subunit type 1 TsaE [Clostridiaceae bacterium]|nr:tRNA (adenosine(37)-N6)-threonylcarbamoyltransferase complex ATPase subunit type 1 TsaE [Clostridiaceae bacterium]
MEKQMYTTYSPEETEDLGEAIGRRSNGYKVIAMFGGLGSGKTAMTRGIARAFGCTDQVSSPTYTIVNEYYGTRRICHFDMYRISGEDGLWEIGWEDYLESGCLCVVEWSENIVSALPKETLKVSFEVTGDDTRRITVEDL